MIFNILTSCEACSPLQFQNGLPLKIPSTPK